MKFTTALLSAIAFAGTIDPIDAGTPTPNEVYIAGLTYGGTGCPQNTVFAAFSHDRKTVFIKGTQI